MGVRRAGEGKSNREGSASGDLALEILGGFCFGLVHMSDLHFYVDDSGTRSPDRKATENPPLRDWFALGGVLIKSEDERDARALHSEFCERWQIDYPLHSENIRFKSGRFNWLKDLSPQEQDRFYSELGIMLTAMPVRGLACVIDRPGYNHRYFERYGRQRWSLCKTAFSVILERAVKLALQEGRRLRVYPERADKDSDGKLKSYFTSLRQEGMPFDQGGDPKYDPLTSAEFSRALREFRLKFKASPLIQIADLYLYPMCRNGYQTYRPFEELKLAGKLVDCHLSEGQLATLAIKYSCFDLVAKGVT